MAYTVYCVPFLKILHHLTSYLEKNALCVWDSAIKFGTIDQDDLLRVFSDIVNEWYVISVLESNNEELLSRGHALDTLFDSNLVLIML